MEVGYSASPIICIFIFFMLVTAHSLETNNKGRRVITSETRLRELMVRGQSGDGPAYHLFLKEMGGMLRAYYRKRLGGLPDEELSRAFPDLKANQQLSTGLMLLHLATHLAFHLGQVGYLRRTLTGDSTSAGAVSSVSLATLAGQGA